MTTEREEFYRYVIKRYSPGTDEWGDALPGAIIQVILERHEVMSHTTCGVWIRDLESAHGKKFINTRAKKQFACATIEAAKISFLARQRRRQQILHAAIQESKQAVKILIGDPFVTEVAL